MIVINKILTRISAIINNFHVCEIAEISQYHMVANVTKLKYSAVIPSVIGTPALPTDHVYK